MSIVPLAPAHLIGLGAFQIGAVLALVDLRWAAVPLAAFVVCCAIAPFFPRWRLLMPIVSQSPRPTSAVALTFDDGPDPATTRPLLARLARHGVTATFFVVGQRVEAHPELVTALLEQGHTVGNHSYSHDPWLMLRSRSRLSREIATCQAALEPLGVKPLTFRPPVGIVNPRLWRVLLERGLIAVGFRCRATDFGNRRLDGLARRILGRVRPGDIVLLHDGPPPGGEAAVARWLEEVEQVLAGLKTQGMPVVPLERLIGAPVTERVGDGSGQRDPVRAFYDGLADRYDAEQQAPGAAGLRAVEGACISRGIAALIEPGHRVLEIGAGTGRFTLPLARRAASVVAVDLSLPMLAHLQSKLDAESVTNVTLQHGDIRGCELQGTFDVICAFSTFEYLPRLEPFLTHLAHRLGPGGVLYFTTAHRSLFRLFVQMGNAMRQGVWLHARGVGAVRDMLSRVGLTVIRVDVHGATRWPGAGMLLEVVARREGSTDVSRG